MNSWPVSSTTTYRIERDDDVPLSFTGVIIGQATDDHRADGAYREVTLFRTEGGRLVASTFLNATHLPKYKICAEVFGTAQALITWLREPDSGALDRTSLRALEQAAGNDPEVTEAFCQVVP